VCDIANGTSRDWNHDGIPNGTDKAPLSAEDADGFRDEDGSPDPDNDADGLEDASDACPMTAGPLATRGCPDVDADGDGIPDRLDRCIEVAEDHDEFLDDDGCPDPDNDADGVDDAVDACPRVAGPKEENGCLPKDSDADGVADFEDNCPFEGGPRANAGCEALHRQLISLTLAELIPAEPIAYEHGKAAPSRKSVPTLDNLAQVLAMHPEIWQVQIVVEEPTVSSLTIDRANAVKTALVKKGVAPNRLAVLAGSTGAQSLKTRFMIQRR
jgi:hypothetical protein